MASGSRFARGLRLAAAAMLAGLLVAPGASGAGRRGVPRFRLDAGGQSLGTFASAAVTAETQVIEFRDGGSNETHKVPGRTTVGNIVLRRGFVRDQALQDWLRAVRDGTADRRDGAVVAIDARGAEVGRIEFTRAWPAKWTGFLLEGKALDQIVEEIELAVEGIAVP